MDNWNRIEYLETDPHKYAQVIFNRVQMQFSEEKIAFFDKWF